MSLPQTLSIDEARGLLAQLLLCKPTSRGRFKALRNHLIGLLMLDTGIRVGELVQLKIADLIVAGEPVKQLRVRPEIAKTNVERFIPVSERLNNAIYKMHQIVWVHVRYHNLSFAFYTFLPQQNMTVRQVQRIIEQAGLEALKRKIHPHMLRHTFGSAMLKVANIRVTQQLLGHASITSTQIYTHPDSEDRVNGINRLGDLYEGNLTAY